MNLFLWGFCTAAFLTAAIFFARFYRQTADRFFLALAFAFLALSINYGVLGIINPAEESREYLYLLRLSGFLAILWGIVDKSRRG